MKLWKLARLIRSKNAGPFELTFDVIFNDARSYERVRDLDTLNAQLFSGIYGVAQESVRVIHYPAANAIKVTIPRLIASGDLGDADVYGGQQHGPLVDIDIPATLPIDDSKSC